MEEKSIDELRREVNELYQAKLQAYQQIQNSPEKPKETAKSIKTVSQEIKPPQVPDRSINTPKAIADHSSKPRKNLFVVSVFTLLTIMVLLKVLLLRS